MKIGQQIIDFMNEHHLLTLAASKVNAPYYCNVFYVYDAANNQLIFPSNTKT